jgi:hypothetical protein
MGSGMKFADVMRKHTNAELIEICTRQREDYQPEALEAAEAEMARRDLSVDQIKAAEQQIEALDADRQRRANLPLDGSFKVWALLMPGIANLLIARTYKIQGNERMYKEAKAWAYGGLALYGGLIALVALLSRFR